MPTDHVEPLTRLTVADDVARLELNDPARRNALTVELLDALARDIDDAVDSGARAIVLSGAGPAFCAGLDLTETDPQRLRTSIELLLSAMRRMLEAPIPVIARVHGPARAGGLGLVAAADVAVAAESVDVAFTEVRLGLAPAAISVCVLPKLRPRDASRLLLTAERVTAAEAAELGLFDAAVPDAQLDDAITEHIAPLLAAHPQGMQATKALLTAPMLRELDARGDELVESSWRLFTSPAAREAIAAARRR